MREQVGRLDAVVVNSGFSPKLVLKVTEGVPKRLLKDHRHQFGWHLSCYVLLAPASTIHTKCGKQFIAVASIGLTVNDEYTVSRLEQVRVVEMIAEQYKDENLLAVTLYPGAVANEAVLRLTPKDILPGDSHYFPHNQLYPPDFFD